MKLTSFQSLLELSSELGSCYQSGNVEGINLLAAHAFRHFPRGDASG